MLYTAIVSQLSTRWSAVRQARAITVSVGLRPPEVGKFEAPRTPRFGISWEKHHRSVTSTSGSSPIRVPP